MIQPDALKQKKPWMWSPGIGTDVWEMFCACITGDLETVRGLVHKDPSLVRSHYEYRTPLLFAVRENRLEVAAFLLDHGADPFGVGGDLLEVARDRRYVEMERLLESKYVSLHGASSKGEAVAAAIRERNLEIVRQLLDETPQLLHAGDGRSNRPIHWAVMTRQLDIIDELLTRGADINARRQDGARPIQLTNGDYLYRGWRDVPKDIVTTPDDVYRHLVARGAYVDIGMAAAKGDLYAAKHGRTRMVEFLLRRGAKPNLPDDPIWATPLAWATRRGHEEIVRLLTEYERSGALPGHTLEYYETLASNLVEAYRSGDDGALRRVMDLFEIERMLTWDRRPQSERVARLRRWNAFNRRRASSYPPAMAPMTRKGSTPLATASGSGASGCSCDRSCSHAKNRR